MPYDITVTDNITLVVLNEAPSDLCFVSSAFEALAEQEINIDMISQSPPKGSTSGLSFTLSDEDLGKALEVVAKLRDVFPHIKIAVSSGNSKILVSGSDMRNKFGIASAVFNAAAKCRADVRMITTSEVDISILVGQLDTGTVVESIKAALNS